MPSVPVASRFLYALAWLLGRLPRPLQRGLGTALGDLAWRANGREPRVARRNLELALPDLAPGEREALVRAVMHETGRTALETLRLWTARREATLRLVPAEATAMRPLLRALQAGEVVGITPDHQPKLGGGEFAPFFGVRALTLSLIPKLAARTGAPVLMGYAERHADGRFTVRFEPAPAAIASRDLVVATTAMNAAVEAIARRDLRQYQWTYKRYTLRPPGSGEPNPYQRPRKEPG